MGDAHSGNVQIIVRVLFYKLLGEEEERENQAEVEPSEICWE